MALIKGECDACGGIVEIDEEKKTAICRFCGNSFIVEEAINHFNTVININEHSGITVDMLVERADLLCNDGEFVKADGYYYKALERSPRDHRAHWGRLMARLKIEDSRKATDAGLSRIVEDAFYNHIQRTKAFSTSSPQNNEMISSIHSIILHPHYKNAVQFAPIKKKSDYIAFHDRIEAMINRVIAEEEAFQNRVQELKRNKEDLKHQEEKLLDEWQNIRFLSPKWKTWLSIAFGVLVFIGFSPILFPEYFVLHNSEGIFIFAFTVGAVLLIPLIVNARNKAHAKNLSQQMAEVSKQRKYLDEERTLLVEKRACSTIKTQEMITHLNAKFYETLKQPSGSSRLINSVVEQAGVDRVCRRCNKLFSISKGESDWLKERGFELFAHCPECRKIRKKEKARKHSIAENVTRRNSKLTKNEGGFWDIFFKGLLIRITSLWTIVFGVILYFLIGVETALPFVLFLGVSGGWKAWRRKIREDL